MDLEYEMLKAIYNSDGQRILKKEFDKFFDFEDRKIRLMFYQLYDETKCIVPHEDDGKMYYYLQPPGMARYLELEKERERNVKSEKQQAFENKISVANVVIPIVSFFAGVAAEHWGGILEFISVLFH